MIDGVMLKKLDVHPDERGSFTEIIRISDPFFAEGFAQLSHSYMVDGVVKAWHVHKTQIDWWYVASGTIKAVLYDARPASHSYKNLDEYIVGQNGEQIALKIPAGVAHGLKVIEGPAHLLYVTSSTYRKEEEGRIRFDDPNIGYDWVQGKPISNTHIT